jgi:hypothetical protein
MRCYICDRVLREPNFNRDHIDWEPCEPCLEVIQDTLAAWVDKPSAAEGELLSEEDVIKSYFGPFPHL